MLLELSWQMHGDNYYFHNVKKNTFDIPWKQILLHSSFLSFAMLIIIWILHFYLRKMNRKRRCHFWEGLFQLKVSVTPIHLLECYSMCVSNKQKKTIEHISSDNHLYGTIIFLTQKSIAIIMRTVLIEAIYCPFFTKT